MTRVAETETDNVIKLKINFEMNSFKREEKKKK